MGGELVPIRPSRDSRSRTRSKFSERLFPFASMMVMWSLPVSSLLIQNCCRTTRLYWLDYSVTLEMLHQPHNHRHLRHLYPHLPQCRYGHYPHLYPYLCISITILIFFIFISISIVLILILISLFIFIFILQLSTAPTVCFGKLLLPVLHLQCHVF